MSTPHDRHRPAPGAVLGSEFGRKTGSIWSTVLAIVLSTIVIIGWQFFFVKPALRDKPITLEDRITTLTDSLTKTAALISEIEQEINQRKQLAERLKADADQARKLSQLNADQVQAVAQALRGELKRTDQSDTWISIGTNVFFAFLGAVFGELFNWLRDRRRRMAQPVA